MNSLLGTLCHPHSPPDRRPETRRVGLRRGLPGGPAIVHRDHDRVRGPDRLGHRHGHRRRSRRRVAFRCPLQVSGPAAGLTVIVYELIREQGLEAFAVIVIAAGFIQILWSWLQLGQWFRAVSPAVIHGMLAGIGALIFASQFHIMIDDLPKGSGLENILSLPAAVWKGLIDDDSTPMNHHLAARIGVLTIGTMVLWNVVLPKRFHVMPAVLLGVATATAVSALLDIPIQRIEVQDNLLSIVHFPSIQMLSHFFDTSILAEALGLAFIASVETLLSASAVDQLHTGPRTRYNRELLAQGVGNIICGFLGSLPMTGSLFAAPPTWRPARARGHRRSCTAYGYCSSSPCCRRFSGSFRRRVWALCSSIRGINS